FDAVRQKERCLAIISAQYTGQEGERSHSVHVVIAKKHNALAAINRVENAFDNFAHSLDQKWVAQTRQSRIQKRTNLIFAVETFSLQETRNPGGAAQIRPGNFGAVAFGVRRKNPKRLHWLSYAQT